MRTKLQPQAPKEKHVLKPMDGIKYWKNPKNNFAVFELHYKADPDKRSEEWIKRNRSGIPRRKWLQEYELRWESWSGKPVYADFVEPVHVIDGEIDPVLGLPLVRGWDFGLTPAAVIAQIERNRLSVIREFTSYNKGIEQFSEEVISYCKIFYPHWCDFSRDWVEFIDPAGNKRNDVNTVACANVLKKLGLRVANGSVDFVSRRSAVEHFLIRSDSDGPCFQLSGPKCPVILKGFQGGYRYPDEKNIAEYDANQVKPLKDEHSHPHDALQYLASGILKGHNRVKVNIPTPGYAWSRRR